MRRIVVVALSGSRAGRAHCSAHRGGGRAHPQAAKSRQVCTCRNRSDCAGKDLTGLNLKGRNLKGIDLRGCPAAKGEPEGANLKGARLQHADIHRGDLRKTRLVRAKPPEDPPHPQ